MPRARLEPTSDDELAAREAERDAKLQRTLAAINAPFEAARAADAEACEQPQTVIATPRETHDIAPTRH